MVGGLKMPRLVLIVFGGAWRIAGVVVLLRARARGGMCGGNGSASPSTAVAFSPTAAVAPPRLSVEGGAAAGGWVVVGGDGDDKAVVERKQVLAVRVRAALVSCVAWLGPPLWRESERITKGTKKAEDGK